jgi:predicted esterase
MYRREKVVRMNEMSSKFVDSFAVEKLINEKLSKVSHSPLNSLFKYNSISFEELENRSFHNSKVEKLVNKSGISVFSMPSYYNSSIYEENDKVYIYHYPANEPKCNVLLLHGLFDDNMANYMYLIKQLNTLNINVFFMLLPYHFERMPAESYFSGEYFFSADVYRTCNAIKQSVFDIEASMQFIESLDGLKTILTGFSMGGCMAFKYFLLKKQTVKTFLFNPVTDLTRLVLDNQLLVTIGRDILKSGFDMEEYTKLLAALDPCENANFNLNNKNIAMAYSLYDQIIEENKYKKFLVKTGIRNVFVYSAGHLNVLRVPRLAKDIINFYNSAEISGLYS